MVASELCPMPDNSLRHFQAESKHYLGLVEEKVKVDASSPSCLEPSSFKSSSTQTPIL